MLFALAPLAQLRPAAAESRGCQDDEPSRGSFDRWRIFYVLSTGCQWGALPKDLPPKSTVYDYFDLWGWDGTLERIHHTLYVACREQVGKDASRTAAIMIAGARGQRKKGGFNRSAGLHAGKKIAGRKRHISYEV